MNFAIISIDSTNCTVCGGSTAEIGCTSTTVGWYHPKIGRHVPPNAHQWSTNTETQIHKYKLLSQSDQTFSLDMALIPNQLHSNQDESDE